jgi:hypothetical protein
MTVATWGLLIAFVVHDAEEWFTMPGWVGRNADRLRRRYPRLPEGVLRRLDLPATHIRVAIALMGLVFLVAAADGARTEGQSLLYQVALVGFGVHALGHVGQAVLARGYTPGVVTAVLVVAPFSVWAWLRVRAAGAVDGDGTLALLLGVLAIAPAILAAHLAVTGLARAYRAVLRSARRRVR